MNERTNRRVGITLVNTKVEDDRAQETEDIILPPVEVEHRSSRGLKRTGRAIKILSISILSIIGLELYRVITYAFELNNYVGTAFSILLSSAVGYGFWRFYRWYRSGKQLTQYTELRLLATNARTHRSQGDKSKFLSFAKETIEQRDLQIGIQTLSSDCSAHLDSREMIDQFEAQYLRPVDEQAQTLIANETRAIALQVGVSPFAVLDMGIVLVRCLKLVGQLCRLYGVRPTKRAQYKIFRKVLSRVLAVGASEIAIDTLLPELGASLLTTLSSRAAQGIGAGVLTARLGVAVAEEIRPVEFRKDELPSLKKIVRRALTRDKDSVGFLKELASLNIKETHK